MFRIKKKQNILYKFNNGYKLVEIKLKVIHKEKQGNEILAKCKVISKDWYELVYVTQNDINSGNISILE